MRNRQVQWETIGRTENLVYGASRGLIRDGMGNVTGLRNGWVVTRSGGTRYAGVS